jgi:hypothetical protein
MDKIILAIIAVIAAFVWYFKGVQPSVMLCVGILLSYGYNRLINSRLRGINYKLLWILTFSSMIMYIVVPIFLFFFYGYFAAGAFVVFFIVEFLLWNYDFERTKEVKPGNLPLFSDREKLRTPWTQLISELNDGDVEVRLEAVAALNDLLGHLGTERDNKTIEALVERLKVEDDVAVRKTICSKMAVITNRHFYWTSEQFSYKKWRRLMESRLGLPPSGG